MTGPEGEALARAFLEEKGLRHVRSNYRLDFGEIDIIMMRGERLVFVEVKTRRYGSDQSAFDAISKAKQRRISKVALAYIAETRQMNVNCSFDVVIITGEGQDANIAHYPDAFMFAGGRYFA